MKRASELFTNPSYNSDYDPIIKSFGDVLLRIDSDGYEGDTRVLLTNGSRYGYILFGWGSCSGCDALQSCNTYEEIDELIHKLREQIHWFNNFLEMIAFIGQRDWEGCEPGGGAYGREFASKAIKAIVDRELELIEMEACIRNPIPPPPADCQQTHCGCVSTGHGTAPAGDFVAAIGHCGDRVTIGDIPSCDLTMKFTPADNTPSWCNATCASCGWFYQYDKHDIEAQAGTCECRMCRIQHPDLSTPACPAYQERVAAAPATQTDEVWSCSQCATVLRDGVVHKPMFGCQGFTYCEACYEKIKQVRQLCSEKPINTDNIRCGRCGLFCLDTRFYFPGDTDPYCEECYEKILQALGIDPVWRHK